MNHSSLSHIDWSQIDTILVDMDGTLLDLAFDTRFWLRTLPQHMAEQRNCSFDEAFGIVIQHAEETKGTIKWYCIDHWGEHMSVDIRSLKHQSRHLIRWLPGAEAFIQTLASMNVNKWLATNAHPYILSLKQQQVCVQNGFDRAITCNEFNAPKESPIFWSSLESSFGVDLSKAIMIDDSLNVLEAAANAGVAHAIEILNPDSEFIKEVPIYQSDPRFCQIQGVSELTESIKPYLAN